MQVIRGSSSVNRELGPCAVGIGIFDAVHLGHQALLSQAVEIAKREGMAAVGYTFDPHPATVLNPALAPKLLEPLEVRLGRLSAVGIGATVVEPFSRQFAATDAESFVREILVDRLSARHVFVGSDFTFGRGRRGNVRSLAERGHELGFEVHAIDIVRVDGMPVSSTKIREFIWAGAVRGANLLLGRPFMLGGVVVRGVGRGARLGFATANLRTANEIVPAIGVYAAYATVPAGCSPAVVNIGFSPTFGEGALRIEAHLLDYQGGVLYGQPLTLEFVDRIRDERRFPSVEALRDEIRRDIAAARRILADNPPRTP